MSWLADLTWPKRTERLVLRPTVPDDLDAIWEIRRLEQVGRWMTELSLDREEFRTRMAEPERASVTLTVELGGAVVGDLMLRPADSYSQSEVRDRAAGSGAEIGWCIDPAHGGHGYATEAAAELLRIGFAELGLHRVVALCFADNEPSWRLMERLGMRREAHHVKESLHRELGWVDGLTYALLAEEWAATR